ncbi:MAG: site-specific DNA-methyltransferase [Candidatus Accumulibacter sp.]|uniref:Site-specific DNA-methyltransferase n=1 Tax=Candidatus Accumulibacter proximus TaxID=2954385 RepID=A0A935UEX5_9PROT|nr:site-specific DNA-methyltransferase [Candidatus Accumulibacter proximus]
MSQKYEKLKTLLQELFQLDQPDLDFGLYRVMHAKSAEVSQFLDKDLLPQVQAAFGQYRTADKAEIEKELAKVIAGIEAAGMDPKQSPRAAELRARLANDAVDIGALESEVYDHLFSFFRRYYSEGDFLAKRVYKPGVYAIPYEGEEVTLHWANKDQYYIKTSEYLRDYAFRLRPDDQQKPMRVHFRLADAVEGEHGNVKAAEGKDRVFILAAAGDSCRDFIAEEDGEPGKELVIRFEYRPATLIDWPDDAREGKTKPPAQKDLIALAVKRVLAVADASLAAWIAELGRSHITASGERADYTRLEAHLKRYTARNTFDYFIHKDLGGFLRRELDFYIKNEVMHLDDVENETVPRVEQYLSKVKVIRRIAGKIIDFLAQLEDFQKKLWLKKKFVVQTQYCITLGCIPETFHPEIAANEAQHEEWVKLLAIDEIKGDMVAPGYSKKLKSEFLKAHSTLVVDTQHFDARFTARLLEAMGDVADQTDGVVFHSENFQALSLMQARYREQVKCIYIDPPYNTDAGPIDYKNGYRSSSWMSMIQKRLSLSRALLSNQGVLCVTIDDYQVHELASLIDQEFGKDNQLGTAVIRNNPSGRPSVRGLSVCHEYAFFYTNGDSSLERLPRTEKQLERFSQENGVSVNWQPFRKGGGSVTYRVARPKQYYPIYVRPAVSAMRIPALSWNNASRTWDVLEQPAEGEVVVWPTDEKGQQRIWSFNHLSAIENLCDLEVRVAKDGTPQVYRRHRPTDGVLPRSWWDKNTYAAREYGSATLSQLFGAAAFSFAKSPFAVQDSLWVSGLASESDEEVLDFFAGSGTTGHAAINLNREDGGRRKFILVEIGDYFDTVLLPRVKKVTFTPEWKDGKPKRLATPEEAERSPRIIKVLRLESYEDALNNLEIRRTAMQRSLLGAAEAQGADGLKEQYILRYMLDVETRGSQSLLNVQAFTDPTAYKLKVKRPGSDESREVNVDLLETFNWLIGLTVQHIAAPQTFSTSFERDSEKRLRLYGRLKQDALGPYWFRTVTGTTPDGRTTLIIWRKLTGEPEQDNLVLDEWFTKQGYSAKDSEFDLIYVNGGNNLENLKTPDDLWKGRLIEEDFHRLMFEADGV